MNNKEMDKLHDMWNSAQVNRGIVNAEDTSLSDTCFITFGTYGLVVWKYRRNKWYRKMINDWHNISFAEFKKAYKAAEWEDDD